MKIGDRVELVAYKLGCGPGTIKGLYQGSPSLYCVLWDWDLSWRGGLEFLPRYVDSELKPMVLSISQEELFI